MMRPDRAGRAYIRAGISAAFAFGAWFMGWPYLALFFAAFTLVPLLLARFWSGL